MSQLVRLEGKQLNILTKMHIVQCCLDDPCKGPSINDKDHLFGLLTRDVHTNNAFDQLREILQL